MQLFGFTLLRNAVKYDYCFQESLASLSGIVRYTCIAMGEGEDNTSEIISKTPNLKIIPTVWDQSLRDSGLILSQQTNIALEFLRVEEKENADAWAFYLQADEVLHEIDYELIREDIQYAEENGFDAVAFRYKHFWLNHNTLTVGKKWYPIETRAIKLHSSIISVRDAQGFEGCRKVYESNAFIYHYGHVRQESIYRLKKADFHKLYNADENLQKAQKKEEKKYKKGRFLSYLGSHPSVMKARIELFGDVFKTDLRDEIWILAAQHDFPQQFVNRILAKKIYWIDKIKDCRSSNKRKNMVIFEPSWWQKMLYPSMVNKRPDSDLGSNWTKEYVLTLKLSEKLVGVL